MSNSLQNKHVLFIIAFRDFRDQEYFIPREILEKAGVEIKVASDDIGLTIGADGGDVNVNMKIEDVNVFDFDAIIFIGGPGALKHLDNEKSYGIAKEAVAQDKILASICIASVILAKAGVLQGKKATVWTNPMEKIGRDILIENGAIYQQEPVVKDGKIITANGPDVAEEFGKKLLQSINNQ